MGTSSFLPVYQSLMPSSSSSSSSIFLCTHIKSAENKKCKNGVFRASMRRENTNETNFCERRAFSFLGFSSLPLLLLKTRAAEGEATEKRDIQIEENQNVEEEHHGEGLPNPFLSLLNVIGIISSGVLGALYASSQKEKTAMEETIESMKAKISEKTASMASLEKNFEIKLLNEKEERGKQIRKVKEENQSLSNKLASANDIITGLGRELQNKKKIVEELKWQIARFQTDLTKAGEEKRMLEAELKGKANLMEDLQEKINLLSLEITDDEGTIRNLNSSITQKEAEIMNLDSIYKKTKDGLAEAKFEIERLKEEVLKTRKELDLKNGVVGDLNARIRLLVSERDDSNRRVEALQDDFNDLKLSSERKEASDAELLVKREHEIHEVEEKLGVAMNESTSYKALISDLTQERDSLREMLEVEVKNVKTLRKELRVTQENLEASRLEAFDLSKQLELSQKSCRELAFEVSNVKSEFTEAQEAFKKSFDDIRLSSEALSSELSLVKEVLKKTKEELKVVSDELEASSETHESLKKELLDIYKIAEVATNDLKEEKKIVASLNKAIEASEKKIMKDLEERKALETDLEGATKSLEKVNKNAFMLSRDLEMANSRISDLEGEKDMLHNSVMEQRNVAKEARENVEDAHNLVMRLGKERESLEKRSKKLEEDLASAKGEILLLRSKINSSNTLKSDQDEKKIAEGVNNVSVKKTVRRRRGGSQPEASH